MKHSLPALTAGFLLSVVFALPAVAQNAAIVNGKAVPKSRVDALMTQVQRQNQSQGQGQPLPADIAERVREEVIMREVFSQEAEKRGLGTSDDFKLQMDMARQTLLIRELLADFQEKNPVTDAEVKTEYDRFTAEASGQEYNARHILVEKEEEATALIDQLKKGASFEELATKNSKDPGSAAQGGSLGWSGADSYVPEFSEAMVKLEKGQYTQAPVKSQFGFHVIQLEDTRPVQLPAVDEVRPQIEQALTQRKLTEFQEELRSKARIE